MRVRYWIKKKLGIIKPYPSATSKVRHLVEKYCVGKGCDVGFGGDKIVKVNCDGIDYTQPYAYTGKDKVDIPCKVGTEPIPVPPNTYDYVYSSHLIEDFEDTTAILEDFVRIIKPGGTLILVFPDQPVYEEFCKTDNQPQNLSHVHKDMGLDFMLKRFEEVKNASFEVIFTSNCEIDYNVIIVAKVIKR
jgi:ubiquinone/menaquinone biosynthesis C-methylase UbiE